jgi:hypothetical protein
MSSTVTMPTVNSCAGLTWLQAKLGIPLEDGSILHEDCLIVSVDSESYGWSEKHGVMTEGVISIMDTRKIRHLPSNPSNSDIMSLIACYHFRPKETSMLENGVWNDVDFNHANHFHYGRTIFLPRSQIEPLVKSLLMISNSTSPSGYLPVHMIFRGKTDDPEKIGGFALPAFDFMSLPCLVDEVELQDISRAALQCNVGLKSVAWKTSLGRNRIS